MVSWWVPVLTSLVTILTSSGFWAYVLHKDTRRDAATRLMMGIAYDKITTLGIDYIERGYITRDELEEYQKYFVEPYKALGGNGVAERIYNEVLRLPFQSHTRYDALFSERENERFISDVPVVTRFSKHAAPQR